MGMYTELHFNVRLKQDVPAAVVETLQRMVSGSDGGVLRPEIDHPLFDCGRWSYMLRCDSYYFAADSHSTLRMDNIGKQWVLCVRCNLKNYEGEIELFINWISPYVDAQPGDFLGFYRYEECEVPTIIQLGVPSWVARP